MASISQQRRSIVIDLKVARLSGTLQTWSRFHTLFLGAERCSVNSLVWAS